ncbi:MAG TPA: hypothetical protein VK545_02150 [Streptomyces sp.]|nr:hypothetical protein [Streptomyces sp.]
MAAQVGEGAGEPGGAARSGRDHPEGLAPGTGPAGTPGAAPAAGHAPSRPLRPHGPGCPAAPVPDFFMLGDAVRDALDPKLG